MLLLAGALCTAAFYDDLMAEPRLAAAPIRLVAATLPGFGDSSPPQDVTMENYAKVAGKLAAELGCDAVVGHSLGGNVAIEMAAAGEFSGPMLLLEPSFSRADEYKELRALDRIARVPVVGHLAWVAMLKTIGTAMKGEFPPERHDVLVAEMKKNDPVFCRRLLRLYFEYLDRNPALVTRLCDSGVRVVAVFGDRSDIGLSDEERRGLEACPTVTLVTVHDAGHMVMIDQSTRTAELILELL